MTEYILTLTCADSPGIVNGVTSGLLAAGSNILEQSQYTEPDLGQFFLRTRFETRESDPGVVREAVASAVARFEPTMSLRPSQRLRRALVMVSRLDHCLLDLLYRREIGDLAVEIPLIVSNHAELAPVAQRHGIAFEHVPVSPASKPEAEARLLELIAEHDVDVVVLARYMQVLSAPLCSRLQGRVVNIHHSFLPGFKGARPYHQAYRRGVKMIGATAHLVTADLDEGPIIEQDVRRVTHACSPEELVAIGRDIERRVLSEAVRLIAEDRVLLAGQRTVVFDR